MSLSLTTLLICSPACHICSATSLNTAVQETLSMWKAAIRCPGITHYVHNFRVYISFQVSQEEPKQCGVCYSRGGGQRQTCIEKMGRGRLEVERYPLSGYAVYASVNLCKLRADICEMGFFKVEGNYWFDWLLMNCLQHKYFVTNIFTLTLHVSWVGRGKDFLFSSVLIREEI